MTYRKQGVAFGVLALTIGLGISVSTPAVASPASAVDFLTDQGENVRASLLGQDLQTALGGEANYAGLRLTPTGVEVSVVGSPTATELAAATASRAISHADQLLPGTDTTSPVPVTFRNVANTLASLTELAKRLDADNGKLAASNIHMSSWGPIVADNRVVVHLENYSVAAANELLATYGSGIVVAPGNQLATGSSRTADTAPWYGGDKIYHGSSFCSTWFSTSKVGTGAATAATSGHCGTGAWTQNGNTFGTVSSSHFGGSMDGEIIPVSANSGNVWANPGATTRHVKSVASSDVIGTSFCTDGATNLEVCAVLIYATGQSVTYNGQTITGLVYGVREDGTNAWSAGNSGGPAYTFVTGGVRALGMIEARVIGSESLGWYMPARTIDSYFGLSIKTS